MASDFNGERIIPNLLAGDAMKQQWLSINELANTLLMKINWKNHGK
jgi:hypothetical protein